MHYAKARLETRGWALRESMLATRLLSLGKHELGWKCKQIRTCECLLDGMDSPVQCPYPPSRRHVTLPEPGTRADQIAGSAPSPVRHLEHPAERDGLAFCG